MPEFKKRRRPQPDATQEDAPGAAGAEKDEEKGVQEKGAGAITGYSDGYDDEEEDDIGDLGGREYGWTGALPPGGVASPEGGDMVSSGRWRRLEGPRVTVAAEDVADSRGVPAVRELEASVNLHATGGLMGRGFGAEGAESVFSGRGGDGGGTMVSSVFAPGRAAGGIPVPDASDARAYGTASRPGVAQVSRPYGTGVGADGSAAFVESMATGEFVRARGDRSESTQTGEQSSGADEERAEMGVGSFLAYVRPRIGGFLLANEGLAAAFAIAAAASESPNTRLLASLGLLTGTLTVVSAGRAADIFRLGDATEEKHEDDDVTKPPAIAPFIAQQPLPAASADPRILEGPHDRIPAAIALVLTIIALVAHWAILPLEARSGAPNPTSWAAVHALRAFALLLSWLLRAGAAARDVTAARQAIPAARALARALSHFRTSLRPALAMQPPAHAEIANRAQIAIQYSAPASIRALRAAEFDKIT